MAIGDGEPAQHLVFYLRDESSGPLQRAPTLGRDRYLPCAAVAWTALALGEPGAFEFVDQLDHGARVDAQVGAQLLQNDPHRGAALGRRAIADMM